MEVFPDLGGFITRMRKPKDPHSVAIVWNPTLEDLREIGALRDPLMGIRTLLVLPDQDTETVALAHRVLPSYVSYVEDGISEIVSVLRRLTGAGGGPAAGTC